MSTLDNILADTRKQIDDLRAESADHAREATKLAEQMAAPTDAYRAMEAEHRDLLLKVAALEDEMRTAKSALDAMADERDRHLRKADQAADAADHFETRTLPGLAVILDGADIPPREALAATGLMPTEDEPKPVPYAEHIGHRVDVLTTDLERTRGHLARIANGWLTLRTPEGEMSIPDEQVRHVARAEGSLHLEDSDDLTAPGVADSRAQVAPHLPPPVPHEPAGVVVATGGPTQTMPDTGLAPDPLPPAPPSAEARHARPADRPGLLARLTGGHRTLPDNQDGDA